MMETSANFDLTYDSFAFAWITPECQQGKDPITYNGKQCFHYIALFSSPIPNSAKPSQSKREAWIEAKTLQPVALITENSTSNFTFAPKPPTEPLLPPPAVAKEIAYYKAVMGAP